MHNSGNWFVFSPDLENLKNMTPNTSSYHDHLVFAFQVQVGKAYFEVVDYLEAERAFTLARRASPYSLEGMDIYSTVLYVSSLFSSKFWFIIFEYLLYCLLPVIHSEKKNKNTPVLGHL